MNHWFDGFAMLHRFGIADGEVSYANRFLETKAYRAAKEKGEIVYSEFATDPVPLALRARLRRCSRRRSPTTPTSTWSSSGERYIAMTETPIPVEFDGETLETAGVAYDGARDADDRPSAPRSRDRRDAQLRGQARPAEPATASSCCAPSDAEARGDRRAARQASRPTCTRSASPSAGSCWPSSRSSSTRSASRSRGRPYIENYRWKPELGTRFTLIDRDDRRGDAARSRPTPCFGFHHVNAYEEDGDGGRRRLRVRGRRRSSRTSTSTGCAAGKPVARGRAAALPDRPRPAAASPASSWLRASSCRGSTTAAATSGPTATSGASTRRRGWLDRIVKVDVAERRARSNGAEAGCSPGEPVFVAAPGAEAEDDGVLLSVVFDARSGRSFLLVLDAADLERARPGRGAAPHPVRLPRAVRIATARPLHFGAKGEARSDLCGAAARGRDLMGDRQAAPRWSEGRSPKRLVWGRPLAVAT